MPLFSEHITNMYYSGTPTYSAPYSYSSSLTSIPSSYSSSYLNPGGNYSSHSSIGYHRTPVTSRWIPSNGRNYSPILSTISERGTSSPIRINSPRRVPLSKRTYVGTSSYTPRPICINTADIDVSKDRYRHKTDTEPAVLAQNDQTANDENSPFMPRVDGLDSKPETGIDSSPGPQRSTIKRGRTVVRFHTVKRKERDSPRKPIDTPQPNFSESVKNIDLANKENITQDERMDSITVGWREKLCDDLIYKGKKEKKTLGEKLVEKFIVKRDDTVEPFVQEPSETLVRPTSLTPPSTNSMSRSPERRCSLDLLAEQANVLDSLIRSENLSTAPVDLSKVGGAETENIHSSGSVNKKKYRENSLLKTRSDHSLHDRLNYFKDPRDSHNKNLTQRKSIKKSSSGGSICRLDSITEIPREQLQLELNTIEEKRLSKKNSCNKPKSKLKQKITSSVQINSPKSHLKLKIEDITIEEKSVKPKKEILFSSDILSKISKVPLGKKENETEKETFEDKSMKQKKSSELIESASPEPDDGNFWNKIGKRETVYLIKRKKNLEESKEKHRREIFWFPEDNECLPELVNDEVKDFRTSIMGVNSEGENKLNDILNQIEMQYCEIKNDDNFIAAELNETKMHEQLKSNKTDNIVENKNNNNKATNLFENVIIFENIGATKAEDIINNDNIPSGSVEVKIQEQVIKTEKPDEANKSYDDELDLHNTDRIELVKDVETDKILESKFSESNNPEQDSKQSFMITKNNSPNTDFVEKPEIEKQINKDDSKTNTVTYSSVEKEKREVDSKMVIVQVQKSLRKNNKQNSVTDKTTRHHSLNKIENNLENISDNSQSSVNSIPKSDKISNDTIAGTTVSTDFSMQTSVCEKVELQNKIAELKDTIDDLKNNVKILTSENCNAEVIPVENVPDDALTITSEPENILPHIGTEGKSNETETEFISGKDKFIEETKRLSSKIKPKIQMAPRKPVKDEPASRPLIATPRPLQKKAPQIIHSSSSSDSSSDDDSSDEDADESDTSENSEEFCECENNPDGRTSTGSNDSGFDSSAPASPAGFFNIKKDCDVNCHRKCEKLTANLCGVNQRLLVEALATKSSSKKGAEGASTSSSNITTQTSAANILEQELEQSTAYGLFRQTGRFTPPARSIPRFRKYVLDDFHFIKLLGKGSFGKVLLAELRDTEYYYAVKCLKKDVVLEDDDVECTLIERKVLALGTNHPYLCHLFATFQTDSHLFFVMEYLNGGDLMFHIQQSGRFPESRARFYGAEIVSGLKFLHKRGIVYRDLKLDNILLDFDGHVRIADFGMCKLQIYLDKTADTFCGTPDYMAPEIIKGLKYNQAVDWWSFGVLLYEMLIGQSPFSGCDEDELFWSICNEMPSYPRFLSDDSLSILTRLLDKDARTRLGGAECMHGDIRDQDFFRPINWDRLEARELEAPFKPRVRHPLDTQYFDKAFTGERPRLTAVEPHVLRSMDQEPFRGFSYTNPNATDR